jgi:hypothetical protein
VSGSRLQASGASDLASCRSRRSPEPEAQSRRRAVVALAFVLVAVLASGCDQDPLPPARDITIWRKIGSWSGRTLLQTESFIGNTGAFRVHWQTSNETAPGAGRFRVVLHSSVSGRPLLVAVEHRGVGRDTSYVNEDPREFFIVVESQNLEWSVTVEEATPGKSTLPGTR